MFEVCSWASGIEYKSVVWSVHRNVCMCLEDRVKGGGDNLHMNNGSNALVKRTYTLFRIYIKINFNSIVSMVDRNHPNVFFSFWSDIYFTGACMFELGIYIKGEMKFQIKRASSDEILFCSILFHFISHFHNSFLGVRIKWMELCACACALRSHQQKEIKE